MVAQPVPVFWTRIVSAAVLQLSVTLRSLSFAGGGGGGSGFGSHIFVALPADVEIRTPSESHPEFVKMKRGVRTVPYWAPSPLWKMAVWPGFRLRLIANGSSGIGSR